MKSFRKFIAALPLALILLASVNLDARQPRGYPTGSAPPAAINPIGTNLSVGGAATFDYEGFPLFKNRVRQGFAWIVAGSSGFASVDANGWPAQDWQQTLYSGSSANSGVTWWSGTYQCGYTSRGNGPTSAGGSETIASINGNATVSSISYNSGTKAVLFQLNVTNTAFGYEVTGTTGGGGSGGGTNVFCYLPEYNSNTSIDNPLLSSAFTTEAISFYSSNFSLVRYIWFDNALYNTGQNTATSRNVGGPTGNTQTHGTWSDPTSAGSSVLNEGFPLEWALSFGSASNTNVFYNWPVWEDGTNGNAGTYTNSILMSTQLAAYLAAGHSLFIEIGNELWNGSYPVGCSSGSYRMTTLAATAGITCYQYLGQKIHALALALRASPVASYYPGQINIVLATQGGSNGWDNFLPTTLNYISTTYGATYPGLDVQYVATAPYTNFSDVLSAPFTAFFTASISGTNMTVTGTPNGTLGVGNIVLASSDGSGHSVPNGLTISSQTSGTTGGAGVYVVSASTTMNSAGMATVTAQPTVAQLEANLTAVGAFVPYASTGAGQQIEHNSLTALHFGMAGGYMTYEGGYQANAELGLNQASGCITNVAAMQSDSGMAATMEALWSPVLDAGALYISNFIDGVNQYAPSGCNYSPQDNFGYTFPVTSSNSPKLAALQHYTAGTYTHTRNVVTTPGSFVSAAASADSLTTGNATPLNQFGAVPYTGGTHYGNWWQVYSDTARTSSLAIGVVSGSCTCSFEFDGTVLNPSLSLATGTTNISVNLQKGFNEILIVAPSNNGMTMSGFTFN